MLVELGLVEQRLRAVQEVLDGATVTDVAKRNGVTRQTVHTWLRRYASSGVAGLVDKTSKPESCPHQMTPVVEARIVEMRRTHPGWGPRTIRTHLAREDITPLPGRSSIYRALVRHRLLDPTPRKRARSDYKRWERSKTMELWQMDIVGRFYLTDGTEVKVVTGVDDHSRYCVCARIVARATAKPVCDALLFALKQHGAPNEILTDNGKVFTARFGQGPGPVLFDRICHNNGIKHRLTAPYSPTTTGKVERFHRTYRDEFLVDHDRTHATIEEAQMALDAWVEKYNTERPHQSLGDRPPAERFALAAPRVPVETSVESWRSKGRHLPRGRRASADGSINGARSGSTASAIGSVRPSPAKQSKSSSRTASSRSSIKASSSLPTPSGVGTRPRSRRHRGPGAPARPARDCR